jgi:hypothetical protein
MVEPSGGSGEEASFQLRWIDESIEIACPVEELFSLFTLERIDWIWPFLRLAAHEGDLVAGRARRQLPEKPAGGRTVSFDRDGQSFLIESGAIEIPFRWRNQGYQWVFSTLEGRLLLKAVDDDHSELRIQGTSDGIEETVDAAPDGADRHAVRNLLLNLRTAVEADSSQKAMADGSA